MPYQCDTLDTPRAGAFGAHHGACDNRDSAGVFRVDAARGGSVSCGKTHNRAQNSQRVAHEVGDTTRNRGSVCREVFWPRRRDNPRSSLLGPSSNEARDSSCTLNDPRAPFDAGRRDKSCIRPSCCRARRGRKCSLRARPKRESAAFRDTSRSWCSVSLDGAGALRGSRYNPCDSGERPHSPRFPGGN